MAEAREVSRHNAFLMSRIPRERLLLELGPERVDAIEYERDSLRLDVAWGLGGG